MQIQGVLIDLDLTLVDSQIAASVRKSRKWPAVYEMFPRFKRYEGVSELSLSPLCVFSLRSVLRECPNWSDASR